MRYFVAIAATHMLVASTSWIHGYVTGSYLQRRKHEIHDLFVAVDDGVGYFVDLVDVQPYDGAVDDPALFAPTAPTADIFEWPRGVTVRRPYPPEVI